MKNLILDRD